AADRVARDGLPQRAGAGAGGPDRHARTERSGGAVRSQPRLPPPLPVPLLRTGMGHLSRSGGAQARQAPLTAERIPDRPPRRAAAWRVRALPRPPVLNSLVS